MKVHKYRRERIADLTQAKEKRIWIKIKFASMTREKKYQGRDPSMHKYNRLRGAKNTYLPTRNLQHFSGESSAEHQVS